MEAAFSQVSKQLKGLGGGRGGGGYSVYMRFRTFSVLFHLPVIGSKKMA